MMHGQTQIKFTHFMFNNSNKSFRLLDDMEEYCIAGQATDENVTRAHCTLDI